jgi:hypothetical protein
MNYKTKKNEEFYVFNKTSFENKEYKKRRNEKKKFVHFSFLLNCFAKYVMHIIIYT